MNKLKKEIIGTADSELQKANNVEIQRKMREERAKRDLAIAQKEKEAGIFNSEEPEGWARGAQQPPPEARS